jgi:hypothetical protein
VINSVPGRKKAVEAKHSWVLLQTDIMAVPVFANITPGLTNVIRSFLGMQNYKNFAIKEAEGGHQKK